jgi:hypothetical protein
MSTNRQLLQGLEPNQIVRQKDGEKYFGFRPTQLKEKIEAGEIPALIPLSDSGRAKGWLGIQIIEYQAKRLAAAKARAR